MAEQTRKKRILILGVGAQGSTVAMRMDEEPNVAEIVCADYDVQAVNNLAGTLKKGTARRCNHPSQQCSA